jgi:hypothetical protein
VIFQYFYLVSGYKISIKRNKIKASKKKKTNKSINTNHLFSSLYVPNIVLELLRQAGIRESLGLIEKCYISDYPCSGSETALTWPGNHPFPSPLIDYWMGITWFCPFPGLG